MILDFHTHVDAARPGRPAAPAEDLVRMLDHAGIHRAVVMTYVDLPGLNPKALELVAEATGRYPDRLVGFVRLDPDHRDEAIRALDRAVLELGFRGLKLHPTTTLSHPAGDATVALLRRCAELGVPVLFHCGDDPFTTPFTIEVAAARVPDCAVVLGHMGGYLHTDDAIAAAARQPNLYLETSAMPFPRKVAEAVERLGSSRVIFGSDGPGSDPSLELHKIRMLDLPPDGERRILGENGARLIGLAGEAMAKGAAPS